METGDNIGGNKTLSELIMDAAKTLYDSINTMSNIQEFIDNCVEEDIHLDFKLCHGFSDKPSRKNYGEVLSGFSNSDGGVIVWGIETKKNSNNIDYAAGLNPISNIGSFMSELKSFQIKMLNPPNDGIDHKAITIENGQGYAVTYIPFSPAGPHMAMGPGQQKYFRRSGDAFFPMEHWEVKTAFYREQSPDLVFIKRFSVPVPIKSQRNGVWKVDVLSSGLIVGLHNKGRGSATHAYLALQFYSNHRGSKYGLDEHGSTGFRKVPVSPRKPTWEVYASSSDDVIHPEMDFDIQSIDIRIDMYEPVKDLNFRYKIIAEKFLPVEDECFISGEDIKNEIIKVALKAGVIDKSML